MNTQLNSAGSISRPASKTRYLFLQGSISLWKNALIFSKSHLFLGGKELRIRYAMGIITTKTSNRRQFTRIKYFLLLNIISVTKLKEGTMLNTDSDLMANMYIVLNCRRKLLEHAYGYYGMELKLAFSSL
jgi:hypothetical protein